MGVVEWSRALDIRLSDWCCNVSMVWVQIPLTEDLILTLFGLIFRRIYIYILYIKNYNCKFKILYNNAALTLVTFSRIYAKKVHNHIISLRGKVWYNKSSLAPPLLLNCMVAVICICFYDFFIIFFLDWSDSMIYFVFHFITVAC